jgi:hypothetical protein
MNLFSKCAFTLALVTVTAIGLSGARSFATTVRESVPNQNLGKVSKIAVSTVDSSLSLTSPSLSSLEVAFSPVPNPAPSGTGGSGTR